MLKDKRKKFWSLIANKCCCNAKHCNQEELEKIKELVEKEERLTEIKENQ